MAQKTTKVLIKRRKFISVEIPSVKSKIELIGNSVEELKNKTIKLDLTRQLKGKSVEVLMKIDLENNKAIAHPIKINLMPYFIRRMIRKRISYVEDSFDAKTQESLLKIKPFLITRKRVSKGIRKTLRNKAKNWIEDYMSEKKDEEIFNEILSNKFQKSLSLLLKKTYPLSLCEIRVLEIIRPLKQEEIPKITKKKEKEEIKIEKEEFIDQLKEIEDEKIKKAEKEIKETQSLMSESEENSENKEEKPAKKTRKKKEKDSVIKE